MNLDVPVGITCRFGCPATQVAEVKMMGTDFIFGYLWYCDEHLFPSSDLLIQLPAWKDTSDDGS